MPARTIYIRDEDEDIWRRAEELASNGPGPTSLSAVVTASLRFFVRTREDHFGLVTIRVNRDEAGRPAPVHAVQFAGLVLAAEEQTDGVLVYLTPKRNLVFWSRESDGSATAAGALRVFPSLAAAQLAADTDGRPLYTPELLAAASRKLHSLDGREIPDNAGAPAQGARTEMAPRRLDV